jgi:hypothetical protein
MRRFSPCKRGQVWYAQLFNPATGKHLSRKSTVRATAGLTNTSQTIDCGTAPWQVRKPSSGFTPETV